DAGDLAVVSARRLDVETNPVDEPDDLAQARRVRPARVQPDAEARVAHLPHGSAESPLARGLPTGEHDAVEQTVALGEQVPHPLERDDALGARGDEVGVVAIGAA